MGDKITLNVFCSIFDKLGNLTKTKPYYKDGYLCATDGAIAVRIKDNHPEIKGSFPNLNICFDGKYQSMIPVAIKKPTRDVGSHCYECDNGKVYFGREECKSCHGDGICKCGCPVEHECGKCGGMGGVNAKSVPCRFCEGTTKGYLEYEFEGYFYKGHYMKISHDNLPNLRAVAVGENGVLLMKFDFGECALMPFSK